MMYFYAQLNEESVCCGVSQLSGEVNADNMIKLDSMDATVLGKKYENGEWVEVPKPEPVDPEPSQLDRIEAAVNQSNAEIANAAVDAYTLELMESGVL